MVPTLLWQSLKAFIIMNGSHTTIVNTINLHVELPQVLYINYLGTGPKGFYGNSTCKLIVFTMVVWLPFIIIKALRLCQSNVGTILEDV